MNCPKCSEEMGARVQDGLAIERCPGCSGVWLEVRVLDQLTERHGASVRQAARVEATFVEAPVGSLRCPACAQAALQRGRIGRVTAERCSHCCGIFLEWGGLNRIRAEKRGRRPLDLY